MLTLGKAKESRKLAAAAGVCTSSDTFLSYLNECVPVLMTRGSFWGTVHLLNGCVYNECITWPRNVGSVLAVNTCGKNIPVWNNWAAFVPIGPEGITKHGFGFRDGVCTGNVNVVNDGVVSIFNQVPCGKQRYIRAYLSVRADIGKKITIFGIDANGQTIRTKVNGIWQEGVTLTLPNPSTSPYVSTPFTVREITRVVKEKTQGMVRLFQYDADGDTLHDCAAYEPSETLPEYRHSRIKRVNWSGCCNCSDGLKTIQALTKLQFIELENDSDVIPISNINALALGIQYSRLSDQLKDEEAEAKMARAVHELNLELRDKFPLDQTSVSINPFGTALPSRHRIGRVV